MRPGLAVALLVLGASVAVAQAEWVPRVGFDFDHFGETYRITEDRDTVSTIDDYGTLLGLTVRNPWDAESRFRLDADLHLGRETQRVRLDFEGRIRRGDHVFEVDHEGTARRFRESSDYSVTSDYLEDHLRVGYERRLGERVRLRFRETFDLARYEAPDEFNLDFSLHRPGVDVRIDLGELSEMRLGYKLGKRSVPDSSSLDYWRHTWEADVGLLFGWTASLDVSSQLDRRIYDPGSVRESSWEHRGDATFEFGAGERATFRILHESEIIRYDDPDDLDFDSSWMRTGFQVEVHRTRALDLSVMPVYAFLTSTTAPEEEYSETGLEFGIDWRIGTKAWVNLTSEIGRRDYEISASAGPGVSDSTSLDVAADFLADTAFSDYLYNRFTLLVTSDVSSGLAVNLFANWQPEDHRFNRHDTDTRIVSGGVEYRF